MMVGRDDELRRLVRLASRRRPEVAIVAGEPGIGKTRLVRELLDALPGDTVVLVGHAEPGSLSRPYEVLLDAVDGQRGTARALPPERIAALADPARSPVERLHTGLGLLSELIGDAPAVLVFEDLHWADSESAALFERIAEQDGPRLLIGTYRPDEVTSRQPLAAMLARMERRHSLTQLRLDVLGPGDTAALIASATGRPAPYRTVAEMHHRTGGNPFFLEELLRGCHDLTELEEAPLPWSLAEALRRQADDLAPEGRRILEAAAVLGYRVPFDLLAAVTGAGEDELIAVLRDLVERGVLTESGEDEFSFRHALVREAVKGAMLGRQRRRLHEAALEVLLAGDGSDPAMVAYHARAAGRYDDMVAAARRGAALYLSIGSAYQALELAEMALEELPDDGELLMGAARAAWLANILDDAIRYARRWRDRAGADTDRAEALSLLVRLTWDAGEADEMRAATRELEALVDRLPPGADAARAMTAIAQSYGLRDHIDAALRWADRALALADEHDLPEVRLAALVEKGLCLTDRQETVEAGWAMLSGVVDEAEARGEWVLAARALNCLVQDMPPASAAEHAETLERMRVDAERAGFERLSVAAYYQGLARLAVREGELRRAVSALEHGRRLDRGYERRGRTADTHGVFLAGLYLESGELDEAARVIEELGALAQPNPLVIPSLSFHLACRRGDIESADPLLDTVFGALAGQNWRSGAQAHDLLSGALRVGLSLERLDRMGAELVDERSWDDYRTLVAAQLAEAHGRYAEAADGYGSVTDSTTFVPAVRGTAHVGAARCLLATGAPDAAAEHARLAAADLSHWGGWRADELDRLRARLDLADDRPTGPAALTPREREVALLLADGLTNMELARRLHISPKTAAVHVSNILRKLDITSRTDVTAALHTTVAS